MKLNLESLGLHTVAIVLTILIGFYTYFKWCFKYWERKGLPCVEPSIPFGSLKNPAAATKSFGEQCQDFYNIAKSKGYKHVGFYIFSTPMFMPIDTELIKNIMQKDFDYFVDRGVYYNELDDPLSAHLFVLEGIKWKNLRVKLTPTFTSGKMKMMFPILVECGQQLKEAVDVASETNKPIDIRSFAGCFTANVIGSCAFGLECNCFKEIDSDFVKYAKRTFTREKLEILKDFIMFASPNLGKRLRLCFTPEDVSKFFMKIVKETVNFRESNKVERNDFMHLLINIKNSVKDGLTLEELAAQAFIFFLAGYETSSTAMTFCLYELACNPDIQQKVQREIEKVLEKYSGEISYEALAEMKYLGQVIDETLRKYPPVMFLNRKCIKPYRIPDTDIVLDEGTPLILSVLGLHRDPEYFPDPEKFDPDRFSEENRNKINPFAYLPFGEGPRNCIGLRFGVMQTKIGLAVLLRNYKFSLNNKTKTPLESDPFSFIMAVKGDIWLNTEKIIM